MSCTTSACVGCGSGTSSTLIADIKELHILIADAKRSWSIPLDEVESNKWDQVLNEIGLRISFENAQALLPLVDVYNQFGTKIFLNLCENLLLMQLVGKLICWAYCFCESDSKRFVEKVLAGEKEMVNYVNQQAEFFECFSENGKVGRAIHRSEQEVEVLMNTLAVSSPYNWHWILLCCMLILFVMVGVLN